MMAGDNSYNTPNTPPPPPPPPPSPQEAPPPFRPEPVPDYYGQGTLSYAQPYSGITRPGVITAIGILSIIFASLGILSNGVGTLQSGFLCFAMNAAPNMPPVPAPPTRPLTSAEQQAVLAAARKQGLPAAQATVLQQELASPSQTLIHPQVIGVTPAQQVNGILQMPDGSTTILFYNGSSMNIGGGTPPSAGGTTFSTTTAVSPGPFPNFSTGAAAMAVGGSLLSFGLSIYLLVIGIMAIRQSPRAGQLHWIYVFVKVPVAVLSGVGITWAMNDFFQGIAANMPAGSPTVMPNGLIFGAMATGMGLIYPIVLVCLLLTRTAREYYRAGR